LSENTIHAVKNRLIKTKLTDKEVLEISKNNLSTRKLAKIYNVSASIIWRIKNKTSYKHLW
jgi:DNA invertase Pin-like site-specific DNA recombinase